MYALDKAAVGVIEPRTKATGRKGGGPGTVLLSCQKMKRPERAGIDLGLRARRDSTWRIGEGATFALTRVRLH